MFKTPRNIMFLGVLVPIILIMLTNVVYDIQSKNRKTYCIQGPVGFFCYIYLTR